MPELPDIYGYEVALNRHFSGKELDSAKIFSPFLLRSVELPLEHFVGQKLKEVNPLGKQLVFEFESGFWVIHLMVAGRFHLRKISSKPRKNTDLMFATFKDQKLALTEFSKRKRASLYLLRNRAELDAFHPGGIHPLEASLEAFVKAMTSSNRTIKRQLCTQSVILGIGNTFSDEILHHAKIAPLKHSQKLSEEEFLRLFNSTRFILKNWCEILACKSGFPEKVTAFRPEYAVHGKFGEACPVCQKPVQRIRFAENESNYCARCQTGDKVYSDRALARLLKGDWPANIEEWEARMDPKLR